MQYKKTLQQIGLLLIIPLLVYAGVWVKGWYDGKVAPSRQDTAVVGASEAVAYFAGGCFWCTESDFEHLSGVKEAISGYIGGAVSSPSYKEVSGGGTGHRESVKVVYDPRKVSYRQLVLNLLRHSDPTDEGGSFYDRGFQYTSAIFYQTDEEKQIAEAVIQELEDKKVFEKPIVTSVLPAGTFWVAEEYHQDYYKKNPTQYHYYRSGSGRDRFTDSVWENVDYESLFTEGSDMTSGAGGKWVGYQKPSDEALRTMLTSLQYEVTQHAKTEKPFENEYDKNWAEGIYIDVVSGEPLYSSADKYDSGTGWPSFTKPISEDAVVLKSDNSFFVKRTEVRSRYADSHLGHVFNDGPAPAGLRYCMNSAALRFVPKDDLEKEGLGEYAPLFK